MDPPKKRVCVEAAPKKERHEYILFALEPCATTTKSVVLPQGKKCLIGRFGLQQENQRNTVYLPCADSSSTWISRKQVTFLLY